MQSQEHYIRRKSTACAAIFLFIVLDVLLFRTGFYYRYIKLESAAGIYQYRSKSGSALPNSLERQVAVLGDSRVAQGFSAKLFEAASQSKSTKAINFGMPGSTPRVWYYLLNQIDPRRDKFKVVLVPLTSYWDFDESSFDNSTNRSLDLAFLSPFVSMEEATEIATTFTDAECQREAVVGSANRMFALRRDVRDFLINSKERLNNLKANREFSIVDYNYEGSPSRLKDLLKANNGAAVTDENVTAIVNRVKNKLENPLPPQTGERYRYNSYWLRKLVSAYRKSNTILVFFKIPSDPIKRRFPIPKEHSAVHDLPDSDNLVLVPEGLFSDIETAEYFYDDLHLNKYGRKIMSERLACFIDQDVFRRHSLAQGTASKSFQ